MLIRAAEPADALVVARVHVRSWQAGYRGLLPQSFLDGLRAEDRARRYTFAAADPDQPATLVALDGGTIRGFATLSPARDPDSAGKAELCALYVDPEWWGQGIGAALILAARARFLERGFVAAVLWVLAGNARGERFYRADGWAPDGCRREQKIWGVLMPEVRYERALP